MMPLRCEHSHFSYVHQSAVMKVIAGYEETGKPCGVMQQHCCLLWKPLESPQGQRLAVAARRRPVNCWLWSFHEIWEHRCTYSLQKLELWLNRQTDYNQKHPRRFPFKLIFQPAGNSNLILKILKVNRLKNQVKTWSETNISIEVWPKILNGNYL